jgi:hypothetical protein
LYLTSQVELYNLRITVFGMGPLYQEIEGVFLYIYKLVELWIDIFLRLYLFKMLSHCFFISESNYLSIYAVLDNGISIFV